MSNIFSSHKIIFGILAVLLFGRETFSQSQKGPTSPNSKADSYVAKAGEIFISEREFLNRFEMLPGFSRQQRSNIEYFKSEFLYTLIAEKLLAQEAVERRLDRDSVFQNALLVIRKKLARDELYRVEISQKVNISDVEIIRGIARAPKLLLTSYLYFENEADARFVRGLMKNNKDVRSLKIDSSISYITDTATVIWGDADKNLEEASYKLAVGEVSPVLPIGSGYYIVRLISVGTNAYFNGLSPQALKERVVETVRLRKERERLDEYVADVLKNKEGRSIPKTFIPFARNFKEIFFKSGIEAKNLFLPETIEHVRYHSTPFLHDTLVVVGNSVWTVNDVLSKIMNKMFRTERQDSINVPEVLNTQIKILVQQELLEQEALRRGLDQETSVKEKINLWQTAMLASQMKSYIHSKIDLSDAEIYAYLNSTDSNIDVPQVQIRQLKTSSLDDMKQALNELDNGSAFEHTAEQWTIDAETKKTAGLTPFFPITERAPVGQIAWKMEEGEMYGPISVEDGFLVFQLVGKKSIPLSSDTAFISRYDKAKQSLLSLKRKKMLDLFLAQSGNDRGFTIYQDRLKQITVTMIPMMTFRILGFGGRMFEVPFADPQLDWLTVEPPRMKLFP